MAPSSARNRRIGNSHSPLASDLRPEPPRIRVRHIDDAPEVGDLSVIGVTSRTRQPTAMRVRLRWIPDAQEAVELREIGRLLRE